MFYESICGKMTKTFGIVKIKFYSSYINTNSLKRIEDYHLILEFLRQVNGYAPIFIMFPPTA